YTAPARSARCELVGGTAGYAVLPAAYLSAYLLREVGMAHYVLSADFTDQGIKAVRETIKRADAFKQMARGKREAVARPGLRSRNRRAARGVREAGRREPRRHRHLECGAQRGDLRRHPHAADRHRLDRPGLRR